MKNVDHAVLEVVAASLQSMGPRGPRPFRSTFDALAGVHQLAQGLNEADVATWLLVADVRHPTREALSKVLVNWDATESADWTAGTARNTIARRARIHELLGWSGELRQASDAIARVVVVSSPTVVAVEHVPWYDDARRADRFYWESYRRYLLEAKRWEERNVALLDVSSDRIVERLSDPAGPEAYASRGLVVGYVQSGKTANFTGVIAKAVDAGYRLVIVMSGTLDILRNQTQRRLDMELVGKLQIQKAAGGSETDYDADPDWKSGRFINHGGQPSALGSVDIDRLTAARSEYESVSNAIRALRFTPRDTALDLNHPSNLAAMPVRLLVIKKNGAVLDRLIGDLKRVPEIDKVPALVIDDESDQASINTARPTDAEKQERTAINRKIVEMLGLLKMGQYVGYTATPFANVFIDPDDAADIFPRDFIVSLDRPDGYMGVQDFHDLEPFAEDEEPSVANSNERAFIRPLRSPLDASDADLQTALDTFVLAGAVKLFRQAQSVDGDWRHHTMMIHESSRQDDQEALHGRVDTMWRRSGYLTGSAEERLRKVLDEDLRPVSAARGGGLPFPSTLKELAPFIAQAVSKVESEDRPVIIVNGDPNNQEDTPDFDTSSVWRVIVGGNKLSRGYTVEGLTTTYYRRRATSGSTLMQMGRWFGYRPGYGDLVRLFIGRHEPANKLGTKFVDLYDAFEAVCRDEEDFRRQLRRYAPPDDGGRPMRPMDVPPLVSTHAAWLPPVPANKRYNAVLISANFGDEWMERTVVSHADGDLEKNLAAVDALLQGRLKGETLLRADVPVCVKEQEIIKSLSYPAFQAVVPHAEMLTFIDAYAWGQEKDAPVPWSLERSYLKGDHIDPECDDWLVVIPQLTRRSDALGSKRIAGVDVNCVERSTSESGRFKAFSTPRDRALAGIVVGRPGAPSGALKKLVAARRGTLLLYAVYDRNDPKLGLPTVGMSLLPPPNKTRHTRTFSVLSAQHEDNVVIDK